MKGRQILDELEKIDFTGVWHMPKTDMVVDERDAIAVKVIHFVENEVPNITSGDMEHVLINAIFYVRLFGTMLSAQKRQEG